MHISPVRFTNLQMYNQYKTQKQSKYQNFNAGNPISFGQADFHGFEPGKPTEAEKEVSWLLEKDKGDPESRTFLYTAKGEDFVDTLKRVLDDKENLWRIRDKVVKQGYDAFRYRLKSKDPELGSNEIIETFLEFYSTNASYMQALLMPYNGKGEDKQAILLANADQAKCILEYLKKANFIGFGKFMSAEDHRRYIMNSIIQRNFVCDNENYISKEKDKAILDFLGEDGQSRFLNLCYKDDTDKCYVFNMPEWAQKQLFRYKQALECIGIQFSSTDEEYKRYYKDKAELAMQRASENNKPLKYDSSKDPDALIKKSLIQDPNRFLDIASGKPTKSYYTETKKQFNGKVSQLFNGMISLLKAIKGDDKIVQRRDDLLREYLKGITPMDIVNHGLSNISFFDLLDAAETTEEKNNVIEGYCTPNFKYRNRNSMITTVVSTFDNFMSVMEILGSKDENQQYKYPGARLKLLSANVNYSFDSKPKPQKISFAKYIESITFNENMTKAQIHDRAKKIWELVFDVAKERLTSPEVAKNLLEQYDCIFKKDSDVKNDVLMALQCLDEAPKNP